MVSEAPEHQQARMLARRAAGQWLRPAERGFGTQRNPQLCPPQGPIEAAVSRRRYSNDLERLTVDADRSANGLGIAGEAATPEVVAEHRHPRRHGIVLGIDGAAHNRADAERGEIKAVNRFGCEDFGGGRGCDRRHDCRRRGQTAERALGPAQIFEVGRRQRAVLRPSAIGRDDERRAVRVGHAEIAKKLRVDHRVHGGGQGHSRGERQHREQREHRRRHQAGQREPQ